MSFTSGPPFRRVFILYIGRKPLEGKGAGKNFSRSYVPPLGGFSAWKRLKRLKIPAAPD
jgi:hypothetical protein